jgi:hypothetical protein
MTVSAKVCFDVRRFRISLNTKMMDENVMRYW